MIEKKYFKFVKFLFFGFLTYFINIWLTYLLKEIIGLEKEFSYLISLFLVTIINFTTSLKVIFLQKYSNLVLKKYLFFLILITTLNYFITQILSNIFLEKYLYIIIFIVTTFFFFVKFLLYDKFVFNQKNIFKF